MRYAEALAPAMMANDLSSSDTDTSLEACDEAEGHAQYCPTALLASFTLLMAGHGRCVRTAMMLGDREYAMWQLACARTVEDEELRHVAARLFAYFDQSPVVAH